MPFLCWLGVRSSSKVEFITTHSDLYNAVFFRFFFTSVCTCFAVPSRNYKSLGDPTLDMEWKAIVPKNLTATWDANPQHNM